MTDTAHPATAAPAPVKTTLDIIEIFQILPHRFPFLLIDRVIEIQRKQRIVAIKNVTINEPFFAGHFPNLPIMPGVLIVEAIAQAGGALLLTEVEDREDKLIMFTGIERANFRRPVVPGDQLRIEVELKNWRVRPRMIAVRMEGIVYVGGRRWPKPWSAANWWRPRAGAAGPMRPGHCRLGRSRISSRMAKRPQPTSPSPPDATVKSPRRFTPPRSSIPAPKFIPPAKLVPIA